MLSWTDYETADVDTHTETDSHRPVEDVRMSVMWSWLCCFSFHTFSASMLMIRSCFWQFFVCLSSLCGSLLLCCVSMASFFSISVVVLQICGQFLSLCGCFLYICGLIASLFSHFWWGEVVWVPVVDFQTLMVVVVALCLISCVSLSLCY